MGDLHRHVCVDPIKFRAARVNSARIAEANDSLKASHYQLTDTTTSIYLAKFPASADERSLPA